MPDSTEQLGRILVVEDEGVVAADIEHCLADSGFEVTGVAANGEDALLEAAKLRPDLVLMDVRIQGKLDGIETGGQIRRQFGVPIVYLTAHGDKDTIERAKQTEPLGFLLKPFKQADLVSTVQIALDRARSERDLRERERSFFLALHSIPDAVLLIDPEGRLRFINRAAEALTGWSNEEALWQGLAAVVKVVDEPGAGTPAQFRVLSPGQDTEYRIAGRDGVLHWVSARLATMSGVDGQMIRAVILQEIGKQKETLLTLRRQADLLEQAHEPILAHGSGGVITYWNRGAAKLYGFSIDEAMGYVCADLLKTVAPGDGAVELALDRDGRWSGELLQSTKDGRQIVVESSMVVVAEPSGRKSVLETHRDVTERKKVEDDIRQLNAELEKRVRERTAALEAANSELEAFAYSVSHDLRAPLRGIDGWSMALEEEYGPGLDQQANAYLQRVRGEAHRMGCLIDDLLQLSRVTRAQMQRDSVDLTVLATSITARLKEAQPARTMEFLIAADLKTVGDARLLDIALTNLLGNAVKFTAPRSLARIEFGQMQKDGQEVFFIRDNGVGFDMAYAGMLFGAFQRLHKTSEFPGTGIGLATVQRIMRRHGGSVWAESAPEHGATFYFTIPSA